MFEIEFAKTVSEKKYNEDCLYCGQNFVMVFDGASGLDHANRMDCGSDAKWFVEKMKDEIIKHMDQTKNLKNIVKESLEQIIPLYPSVDMASMPSGCLSLMRWNEKQIEYIGFGDSVCLIQTKDQVECLYDHAIEKLDHKAMVAKNKGEDYLSILIKNRFLRNQKKGYCALDLTLNSLDYCIEKQWKIEDVSSFVLMSDGMYQLKEFLKTDDAGLLKYILLHKEKALHNLFLFQEQDAQCISVDRLKKRDDTTCLLVTNE